MATNNLESKAQGSVSSERPASEPEILPCPFCNQKPELKVEERGYTWYCFQCRNAECFIQPHSGHAFTVGDALRQWNTRTTPPREYERGFTEGIEAAAKVAKRHDYTHSSGYRCYEGEAIADEIRSLTPPGSQQEIQSQQSQGQKI